MIQNVAEDAEKKLSALPSRHLLSPRLEVLKMNF